MLLFIAKDPIPLSSEPHQHDLKLLVPGVTNACSVYRYGYPFISVDQVCLILDVLYPLNARPKWIKCQGTVYHLAQFVLTGWQDDDLPQFSKIDDLIYIQSVAIIVATQYHTVGIDRHYHSYLIAITRCKSVIPLTNVNSHPPVNVRVLPSGMHLTLRYHVLNVGHTSV